MTAKLKGTLAPAAGAVGRVIAAPPLKLARVPEKTVVEPEVTTRFIFAHRSVAVPFDVPFALCVQAAGIMGTTGREVSPHGISVGGRVLLKAGTRAVVAYDTDIRFAALELINPDPGDRADPMLKLYGSRWTGSLRVRNPGRLVDGNAGSRGRFDSVATLPD